MVRLGIGLYGVEAASQEQAQLETVGTLKTTISQIKQVAAGDTVGYSRKGKVTRDSRIATIAIGYADGFDRRLSNGVGKVWINGKLAPLIGNVCMDMCMVDITGVEAEEGDEVIIFGRQHPITQMAQQIGTIPYEILTSVSERVKRVFYTS
jgi:alanine racemase